MRQTAKKCEIRLKRGTIVKGKWHHNIYRVVRLLGSGTVGTVYLCMSKGQQVALKVSEQSISMTAEVQALKILQKTKVQDSGLGPYLLDVDDWEMGPGKTVSFYAMEYVQGVSLQSFVDRNGTVWLNSLLFQLLEQLERLHRAGYVFGDLKSENIIVTQNPPTLRLIDVGGMTKMGRSVKEYTNFFDRAYWRLGTRLAEPSYDLFAVTMILLSIFYPRKFTRVEDNFAFLRQKLLQIKSLRIYAPVLIQSLAGRYDSSRSMRDALYKQMSHVKKGNQQRSSGKSFLTDLLLVGGYAGLSYSIYVVLVNM